MTGWPARIAQHEMDHLNGKMFLDIMQPNTLMCTAWDRINREGGNIYVSYSPKKMFARQKWYVNKFYCTYKPLANLTLE